MRSITSTLLDLFRAQGLRHTTRDTRAGMEAMLCCPFHGETHPSFTINLDTGDYFCYACEAKGGIKSFLRHFRQSTQGVAIPKRERIEDKVFRLASVHATNPLGDHKVLPSSLPGLYDYTPLALIAQGFDEDFLAQMEIGYDLAAKRIMFPLRNVYGQLVGYSGRADGSFDPRYKIYEQEFSALVPDYHFQKGSVLYNAHAYWGRRIPYLFVVEGFKACLRLISYGEPCVALLGKSLSQVQRYILSCLGAHILLLLDNNPAGISATPQVAATLRSSSLWVSQPSYPPREVSQPDDLTPEEVVTLRSSHVLL